MDADAEIVVMDEPLSHTDKELYKDLYDELMNLDKTVIIIEHEFQNPAEKYNPYVLWIQEGRVAAFERYRELKQNF